MEEIEIEKVIDKPSSSNNNKKQRTKDIELDENVTFSDLLLNEKTLEGLKGAGFFKPSPIQLKAIPLGKLGLGKKKQILKGHFIDLLNSLRMKKLDLIVQAKSGTGKTCVFSVIALEHVLAAETKSLQVLILAPTREVAVQIQDSIRCMAIPTGIKCSAFIGGIGGSALKEDRDKLRACQIAVGTPGRILHLIKENLLTTTSVRIFVLDEADKLLSHEFQDSINAIYSKLPENKQTIFLSATYPSYMASFAVQYMRSPTFVRLNIVDPSLRGIRQFYKITSYSNMSNVAFDYKVESLMKLLSSIEFQQAIIFTNYQIKAENLCQTLISSGWPAIFISGSIEQTKRNFAMTQLKQFKCRILISTDLTARGIDAQNVDLVISMDVPMDPETYLHRIGRAGRYGAFGTSVIFVTEGEESAQFESIINSYNLQISQYNENLGDVMFTRNESKAKNRIDDVTIERVKLNREEFDESLFEYEKHKSVIKASFQEKQQKRQQDFVNKEEKLQINVTMDELERDLLAYKMNTNKERNQSRKLENGLEKYQIDISLEEIAKKRDELKSKMDRILSVKTDDEPNKQPVKPDITKKQEPQNLNDLYKWVKVERPKTQEKIQEPKNQSLEYQQLYSNYYYSYYRHYFNQFYNK